MKREDRERAVIEVACRVLSEELAAAAAGGPSVEQVIHDTLYDERKRLDREKRTKTPLYASDKAFHEGIRQRVRSTSEEGQKALLREMIEHFSDEIAGNFDPRVYAMATKLMPHGLAFLLNAMSPSRLIQGGFGLPSLSSNVIIRGEVETLRRLDERGTVILCPTHLSNLDSPVVGWALYHMGLPPYIYGAGLNLFTNPVLSFFMHNLGAYRVDRKKTAQLYKRVLKAYCTVTLELGYDNLFFPGGTRSRSGAIEPKLKLGLLGCGIRAYVNNLRHKKEKPNIYFVPCTVSYGLVLEAETLIDDYLKQMGRARYVIDDDESSRFSDWLRFLSGIVGLDSRIYLTVSAPLDPFGNAVEADGLSYDLRGRPIDISRYVMRDGTPTHDAGRDAEYTKELGDGVLAAYKRDNVLQSTHVVAFTAFELVRRREPQHDLYRLVRMRGDEATLPWTETCQAVERVMARCRELSDKVQLRLDPRIRSMEPGQLITDALRAFGCYHTKAALTRYGDRLYPNDMNLLFFYRNRASGYGLEDHVDARPAPPPVDLRRRPTGEPIIPKLNESVPKAKAAEPEVPVLAPSGGPA